MNKIRTNIVFFFLLLVSVFFTGCFESAPSKEEIKTCIKPNPFNVGERNTEKMLMGVKYTTLDRFDIINTVKNDSDYEIEVDMELTVSNSLTPKTQRFASFLTYKFKKGDKKWSCELISEKVKQ